MAQKRLTDKRALVGDDQVETKRIVLACDLSLGTRGRFKAGDEVEIPLHELEANPHIDAASSEAQRRTPSTLQRHEALPGWRRFSMGHRRRQRRKNVGVEIAEAVEDKLRGRR